MGTAMKHPVPDRVKPPFAIFDIRALWHRAKCQSVRMSKNTNGHQRVNKFFPRHLCGVSTNSCHVLYQFLPPKTAHSYNTRPRHHNFTFIEQSTDLNHRDFSYTYYINMPTEHSFIDIYSFTLLRMSFLLCNVELRLSTLNKPISDLIWSSVEYV